MRERKLLRSAEEVQEKGGTSPFIIKGEREEREENKREKVGQDGRRTPRQSDILPKIDSFPFSTLLSLTLRFCPPFSAHLFKSCNLLSLSLPLSLSSLSSLSPSLSPSLFQGLPFLQQQQLSVIRRRRPLVSNLNEAICSQRRRELSLEKLKQPATPASQTEFQNPQVLPTQQHRVCPPAT